MAFLRVGVVLNNREYLHDIEHELAALASLAERGDEESRRELRALLRELKGRAVAQIERGESR